MGRGLLVFAACVAVAAAASACAGAPRVAAMVPVRGAERDARAGGLAATVPFEETRLFRGPMGTSRAPRREAAAPSRDGRTVLDDLGLRRPGDAVAHVRGPGWWCTGVLITPMVVLTARHCIVRDRLLVADVPVSELSLEWSPDGTPRAVSRVRAIVSPPCVLGDEDAGDIAALVLDGAVDGVRPARVRRAPPAAGDALVVFGYGGEDRLAERKQGAVTWVTDTDAFVDAFVVHGDSGGPALDVATGEVVGIVSRSTEEDTRLTRVDAYARVIEDAERVAAGAPPSALAPLACAP